MITDGRTIVARLIEGEMKKCDNHKSMDYIPGPIERREIRRAEVINTKVSIRENMERNWKLYYMSE